MSINNTNPFFAFGGLLAKDPNYGGPTPPGGLGGFGGGVGGGHGNPGGGNPFGGGSFGGSGAGSSGGAGDAGSSGGAGDAGGSGDGSNTNPNDGGSFNSPGQYSNPIDFLQSQYNIGIEGLGDYSAFLPDMDVLETAYNRMLQDKEYYTDKHGIATQKLRTGMDQNIDNMTMRGSQQLRGISGGLGLGSIGSGFGGKQRKLNTGLGMFNKSHQQNLGQQLLNYQGSMAGANLDYTRSLTGATRGYEDAMRDYKTDVLDRVRQLMASNIIGKDQLSVYSDWTGELERRRDAENRNDDRNDAGTYNDYYDG